MLAIVIGILLALLLQLAIWEGVVLGAAWLIGKVADVSVNYPLVGGIVIAIWALILAIKILFIYGTYREGKKIEKGVDSFFDKFDI